jgi:flavorubredoxin
MAIELFRSSDHLCVAFNDLVRGEGGAQANQFLIMDGAQSALLDPGGPLLYMPLSIALTRYVQPRDLNYLLASHQDPDVIGSLDSWFLYTPARVVCSQLWGRFIPHGVPYYQKNAGADRYLLLPDEGAEISLGRTVLKAVPAHFLHSAGNFQFYDPVSRILFSGDLGVSLVDANTPYVPVTDFDAHVPRMLGFHRRYMASNRACRWWAQRARQMDIDMLVPQHGLPLKGPAIPRFIDWIESLTCGADLLPDA